MPNTLRKELYFLRTYVIHNTAILSIIWFSGFNTPSSKQKFDEIDVERLNIIDSSGKYCFVLTSGMQAPGAIIGGKEIRRQNSNNAPAILFYNEEGDENGALVAVGKKKTDGRYYAASRLMFDRFQRDEMLSLHYYEDNVGSYAGLQLQDTPDITSLEWLEGNDAIRTMPNGPAKSEALQKFRETASGQAAPRLFVGKNRNKDIVMNMRDKKGQTRLRLQVDSLGTPRLDFLNEKGEITYSLPNSERGAVKSK